MRPLLTESARVDTDLPGAVADHLKEAAPRSGLAAPIRAALWLGGLALALWLSFQWGQTTSVHNDFTQNVWLPARLLMDGANPYNPTRAQIDTALGEYSSQFTGFNSG